MLVLGLLLVVLSGAVGVLLIAYNTGGEQQTVTMFGRDIADVTMMQAFIAGLVLATLFLLGLSMMMAAGRRARQNRARYRDARKEAKTAARERDELADQLRKEEDYRHDPVGGNTDTMVTPPAGTPVTQDPRTAPPPAAGPMPPRHAAPPQEQQVVTNIKPGDSPTR
ncbi:hypothetical protein [Actinophytocola sp. NPDC049390]|uniref:hypothetical protein n=1 Tax=Actinophytocola sp. NPDC049390 TaxID=3363894 RepID=UPI0037B927C7